MKTDFEIQGRLFFWGSNWNGQSGFQSPENVNQPKLIALNSSRFVEVS